MANLRIRRQVLVWAVDNCGLALVGWLGLSRVRDHVCRRELEREARAVRRVGREEVSAPGEDNQLPLALPDFGGMRLEQVGSCDLNVQSLLVPWFQRLRKRHTIKLTLTKQVE